MTDAQPALRIVHVLAPAQFGGLERVVRGLAAGLGSRGHDIHVASVVGVNDAANALQFPTSSRVHSHIIRCSSRSYFRERSTLSQLCRDVRAQIIHTHGYRSDVVHGLARPDDQVSVSTVHGFTGGGVKNRVFERLQVLAFRRFDAVVPVSRALGEYLRAKGVPSDRLTVIPNAWSPPHSPPLSRDESRRLLGLPANRAIIGWVGRLSREKGADVLVEAIAALTNDAVGFAIVGSGPDEGRLREQSQRLGVGHRIRWCGAVPDAAKLYAAFDGFALSSRTEGTPIALLEAMAAEIPIVATAVGGVPDLLGDSSAVLVPPESPLALARGIEMLFNDSAASRNRVAAASQRLAGVFGHDAWVSRYESLYRTLVSELH
jgi:glycosyltransferase involved in cell wall biosynthesis